MAVQLSIEDVEDLLNEKCSLLLTQVQKYNHQLKQDIRNELAGVQQDFNDAVKQLVSEVVHIEKETERKANTIYHLIEEFKEQSLNEQHNRQRNQRYSQRFNQNPCCHHSQSGQRNDVPDFYEDQIQNVYRDYNRIVVGNVQQNNNAYYINANALEINFTQPLQRSDVGEPQWNEPSKNQHRGQRPSSPKMSTSASKSNMSSKVIQYITEFDAYDSEYDLSSEGNADRSVNILRSGKAIVAKHNAWDDSEN